MISEQVLGDCSMRACGLQGTNLYLIKKTMATPQILSDTLKIERLMGEEVRINKSWAHRDGEENPDYPEYIWIVGRRLP